MSLMIPLYGYQRKLVNGVKSAICQGNILTWTYAKPGMPPAKLGEYDFAKLLISAPTGSGKTAMLAALIDETSEDVRNTIEKTGQDNDKAPFKGVVYVVIAPNTLHIQAESAFRRYGLGIGRDLIVGKEVLRYPDGLDAETVLLLNWSSINKEGNDLIAEGERGVTLASILRNTRARGYRIVAIIDEAHIHLDGVANQKAYIESIAPDVQIAVTATPHGKEKSLAPEQRFWFDVPREHVRSEGIIVDTTYVNLELDACAAEYNALLAEMSDEDREGLEAANEHNNAVYIYASIRWLNQLQASLEAEVPGIELNLAAGIQLPDSRNVIDANGLVKENALEVEAKNERAFAKLGKAEPALENTLLVLDKLFGWTVENGRVSIWTATRKENLLDEAGENVFKDHSNPSKVLIFKQAVAVGYDAPRLSTLALLRNVQSRSFALQVIGRATRMPELRHYKDASLNAAYVFSASELVADAIKKSGGAIQEAIDVFPATAHRKEGGIFERIRPLRFPNFYHKRQSQNDVNATKARRIFNAGIKRVLPNAFQDYSDLGDLMVALGFDLAFERNEYAMVGELRDGADSAAANIERVEIAGLKPNYTVDAAAVVTFVLLANKLNASRSRKSLMSAISGLAENFGWEDERIYALVSATRNNGDRLNHIWAAGMASPVGKRELPAEWFAPEAAEDWQVPETHRVDGDAEVGGGLYLYAKRPSKAALDSKKEGHFPDVVGRIVEDMDAPLVAYFKSEGRGLESLAIPYQLGARIHLFYPDWFLYFEKEDGIHFAIVETKSYTWHREQPEEISAKAKALAQFVQEQSGRSDVHVHGAIVNMFGVTDAKRQPLGVIKVVDEHGVETQFDDWLRAEGLAD
jgi:superfamily II DNA or RNA helicase